MLAEVIVCPNCGETLELDASEQKQEFFICPSCGHGTDHAEEARDSNEEKGPWQRYQQWQLHVRTRAPEFLRPTISYLFYLAYLMLVRAAIFVIFGMLGQEVTFRMDTQSLSGLAVAGLVISLLYGMTRNRLSRYPKSKPWIIGLVSSIVVWSSVLFHSPAPSVFADRSSAQVFFLLVLGFGLLAGLVLWFKPPGIEIPGWDKSKSAAPTPSG